MRQHISMLSHRPISILLSRPCPAALVAAHVPRCSAFQTNPCQQYCSRLHDTRPVPPRRGFCGRRSSCGSISGRSSRLRPPTRRPRAGAPSRHVQPHKSAHAPANARDTRRRGAGLPTGGTCRCLGPDRCWSRRWPHPPRSSHRRPWRAFCLSRRPARGPRRDPSDERAAGQ